MFIWASKTQIIKTVCSSPRKIANGRITTIEPWIKNGRYLSSIVRYTCDRGYVFDQSVRTYSNCVEGSKWKPNTLPRCHTGGFSSRCFVFCCMSNTVCVLNWQSVWWQFYIGTLAIVEFSRKNYFDHGMC